ncbi:MAG: hypothetical protein G8237_08635 [Magnetococcales bacterium]|nr:hypothetical protein [Magnetococcales bacterium]
MRLALIHSHLFSANHWTLLRAIRPSALIPAAPRALPAMSKVVKETFHARRFIHWMEKALIGALMTVWIAAGCALIDGLRLLLF